MSLISSYDYCFNLTLLIGSNLINSIVIFNIEFDPHLKVILCFWEMFVSLNGFEEGKYLKVFSFPHSEPNQTNPSTNNDYFYYYHHND